MGLAPVYTTIVHPSRSARMISPPASLGIEGGFSYLLQHHSHSLSLLDPPPGGDIFYIPPTPIQPYTQRQTSTDFSEFFTHHNPLVKIPIIMHPDTAKAS